MQGRKRKPEPGLFICADPYRNLPQDAFFRGVEEALGDLEWVREATVDLYAEGIGRPSLDPVVFVKAQVAGYFQNLVGDSELAFRIADSLTLRRFLGYGLGEETPDRTTLLKTRQRWPVEVFEAIFARVLAQLAEQGLVKGEQLCTDTVLIDANASLDSLRHREYGCSYAEFVKALYSQGGERPEAREVARRDGKRSGKASNQEWVSATDPEAAVAVHPDGHTALSYRLDATMDSETGAMVQIGAAPGNVHDSEDLDQRVLEAQCQLEALGLKPEVLTADRGHHSEENLVEVSALGLTPIIRDRAQRGEVGFRPRDFEYLPGEDVYRCPTGQKLRRRGKGEAGRGGRFQAPPGVCQECPHFGVCTKSKEGRSLRRAEHEAELEANRGRVHSEEGRLLLGKHRQRAEGPWSYAKLYGGLARMATRGLENAWKKALLQGIGWNLMKLIAHLTGLAPRGRSALRQARALLAAEAAGSSQKPASPSREDLRAESRWRSGAAHALLSASAAILGYLLALRRALRPRTDYPLSRLRLLTSAPRVALSQGC